MNKLFNKLFNLEKLNQIKSKQLDELYNKLSIPPKTALLKMKQVRKLHKLRHIGKWDNKDYILVIEPQMYNKVTKLTPKNLMFEKDYVLYKKNYIYNIGYFHSGPSGLAQSGDGGDNGDLWWLANKSLITWLNKILKKGNNIIQKIELN